MSTTPAPNGPSPRRLIARVDGEHFDGYGAITARRVYEASGVFEVETVREFYRGGSREDCETTSRLYATREDALAAIGPAASCPPILDISAAIQAENEKWALQNLGAAFVQLDAAAGEVVETESRRAA